MDIKTYLDEMGIEKLLIHISEEFEKLNQRILVLEEAVLHKHAWTVETTIEPTCTDPGSITYICECGERYTDVLEALGHNYSSEFTIDQDASCTVDGSQSRHCGRCSSIIDVTPIPATGHTFGEWYNVDSPDCTNPGLRMRDCVDCLYAESESLDPLGHLWDTEFTVNQEPTCTIDGSKSRRCTRCPDDAYAVIDDTVIPALGHEWDDGVYTDPTTEADGYTTYTCSRCGAENVVINEGSQYTGKLVLILDDLTRINIDNNDDVLKCCTTAGESTNIIINEISFRKNQVIKAFFGNNWDLTYLTDFGMYFTNLIEINKIPDGITGDLCLKRFLFQASRFNQQITIPEGVTGKNCLQQFLGYCTSFNQHITIPEGVSGDGCLENFLTSCTSFNQPINIPINITGERCLQSFLNNCTSFNQPITIPDGISGYNCFNAFLYGCDEMVSPITINDASGLEGSNEILATSLNSAPMYTIGIPIVGTAAAAFRAKFPNQATTPFRNLK